MTLKHNLSTIEGVILNWEYRFNTVEPTQIPKAEIVIGWIKEEIAKTVEELEQRKRPGVSWIDIDEVLGK